MRERSHESPTTVLMRWSWFRQGNPRVFLRRRSLVGSSRLYKRAQISQGSSVYITSFIYRYSAGMVTRRLANWPSRMTAYRPVALAFDSLVAALMETSLIKLR
jgi:hypothetical protein